MRNANPEEKKAFKEVTHAVQSQKIIEHRQCSRDVTLRLVESTRCDNTTECENASSGRWVLLISSDVQ